MFGYTVVSGDTISQVAAKFGITISQLLTANSGLTTPNNLPVGLTLMIPPTTSSVTPIASTLALSVIPGATEQPAGSTVYAPAIYDQIKTFVSNPINLTIAALLGAGVYFFIIKKKRS